MKKHLIACTVALLITVHAFAQDEPSQPSEPPASTASATDRLLSHVTSTLNVYSAQWLDAPKGITVKPVSLGYSVYWNFKLPLYDPFLTLMLGPGVAFTDFNTNGFPVTTADHDSTYFDQLQPVEYTRNKMRLVQIEAPVELRISSRPRNNKAWFFAPGFVGGLLVNDFMKTTGEDSQGHAFKQKNYYTHNLSRFHYGVSARLGYAWFGLYGYYGLSGLFDEGKGPQMTYYKLGLTLSGY